MISVTDLRKGTTFKLDNQPYQVVEYKHTKLGRGTANIRVKVRNLRTGGTVTKSFTSGAKVERLDTQIRELQYLYRDQETANFMDSRSFEQFSIPISILAEKADFLQEGETVKVLLVEDQPLAVELPVTMTFEVVQAPPGIKGDSANAAYKQVTLANGLKAKVPLFIKQGDQVKVDTSNGNYLERIK